MRRAVILLPLLLLGGCSCQRHSDDSSTPPAPPAADAPAVAATDDTPATALAAAPVAALSAVAAGADDESTVVRDYVNALMRGDRATADAFWSGGQPASRADDAVLRRLADHPEQADVRSLRMDSELPIARDEAQPSRLRDVPVRIRVVTGERTLRFQGWYRLQPRADGSGWEIHGASLQPVLD
ncbi:hypothetical protein ABIA71_002566 [Stenotrophomonas sp. 2619]|uniref:hypothetical protein n=1 Tax=Stenotrophomonas sp. 2619 TaxID=3156316 RepID=UPI0033928F91